MGAGQGGVRRHPGAGAGLRSALQGRPVRRAASSARRNRNYGSRPCMADPFGERRAVLGETLTSSSTDGFAQPSGSAGAKRCFAKPPLHPRPALHGRPVPQARSGASRNPCFTHGSPCRANRFDGRRAVLAGTDATEVGPAWPTHSVSAEQCSAKPSPHHPLFLSAAATPLMVRWIDRRVRSWRLPARKRRSSSTCRWFSGSM